MKGGSHHSVAIDQRDHIVVVEGPQNEARSVAVIAKVKETIPNKPIRYLVNTHVHFDHSGGLRTYVDEGATIVTHEMNKPYYEQAWAAPRTLNPDGWRRPRRPRHVRDLHRQARADRRPAVDRGAQHRRQRPQRRVRDGLPPAEKILMEVDAYAPPAPNAPPPATPSPFAVNLYENIQRLKLDVRQIAALHGPRVATMAELRSMVAPATATR